METMNTKEFIDQLNSNTLKQTWGIKGIVKKSGNSNEVLFAFKGDMGNWHTIPASIIDSVMVIKTFVKEGETYTVAKLHLKAPSSPETKVIYDMLQSSVKGHEHGYEGIMEHLHHFMHQHGHKTCPHCGCRKSCTCGYHKHES